MSVTEAETDITGKTVKAFTEKTEQKHANMTVLPTIYRNFASVSQFDDYLGNLHGKYDIYELNAGYMYLPDGQNLTINYPAFYVTNLSSVMFETSSEFFVNLTYISNHLDPLFTNKEPFVGGVVALCFVISGIVTASWMMVSLLLLSSNTLPNSLILANLFHSVAHTVMLSKLTDYLKDQFFSNFSDSAEIRSLFTGSTALIIVRNLSLLFIYISWVDLVIQMNNYEKRQRILIVGLLCSVLASCFHLIQEFIFRGADHSSKKYVGLKAVHYAMGLLLTTLFNFEVLQYAIKKRKFAFHRKTMALAIFCCITLCTPYVFTLIDLCSDTLRTWSTYVTAFTKLCASVAVWEWIHTIRSLEVKNERKTVLGRRLSNDSFLGDNQLGSQTGNSSGYIFKSINIVQLLGSLRLKVTNFVLSKSAKRKPEHQEEGISLFEMVPTLSRHDSIISERSAVSLVGDYPQFNVDQRFLRNTPSTIQDRATPRSELITPTPNIKEEEEEEEEEEKEKEEEEEEEEEEVESNGPTRNLGKEKRDTSNDNNE